MRCVHVRCGAIVEMPGWWGREVDTWRVGQGGGHLAGGAGRWRV